MTQKQYCGRKVIYQTFSLAEKSMKNLIRHKKEDHLHVYKCPDCQRFHVGHKSERLRNYKDFRSKKRREHV